MDATTDASTGAEAELAALDATAQAELVRTGELSPAELVDAAIARIERLNPQLNAVIGDRFERAREEATEADVPLPEGPFRGVPFLVKDLTLMMEGEPYHGGARFLQRLGYVATHDTYLARRFRAAGFVTLGRTNTPEWGSTITTEPEIYGPTRNPWNLDHSTGGSSGGSAAAVAAGLVPVAHANDGGGSIRIPASECGLFGLKPSRGRVSHGPDHGEGWMGATIEGCVSRSVRDSAAVLDAISGAMPGDPYVAPPPARPFLAEVGADPGHLRIGVLTHPPTPGVANHPECEVAVRGAADLLHGLGHHVEEAFPPALVDESFSFRFTSIVAVATAADVAAWEGELGITIGEDDLEADNLTLAAMGREISGPDYLAAVDWMHSWSRRVVQWWEPEDGSGGFDLLLTPTLAGPPPPLGYLSGPEGTARMFGLLQYTAQFNITGQPACSLPLHWSADGLPVGVQLVGAPWREDLLLRVAAQLEAARPWAARRPPVHA
jgi:amidase